jgi:acyl transferase domain-containing protein
VRRLGLEAFVRGYAESHALRLEDRWRFHSRHRDLPLPGVASHVLAPRDGAGALFVILADAAELRSQGVEVAWTSARPLAAMALVAELPPAALARLRAIDPPADLAVESSPADAVVWRPVPGNLALTTQGCDEFRAAAGDLLAQVGEHG